MVVIVIIVVVYFLVIADVVVTLLVIVLMVVMFTRILNQHFLIRIIKQVYIVVQQSYWHKCFSKRLLSLTEHIFKAEDQIRCPL